jgi:GTPase
LVEIAYLKPNQSLSISIKQQQQKLQIMSEKWNIGEKNLTIRTEPEKAVLVAIVRQEQTEQLVQEYLDELDFLTQTAGAIVQKRIIQKLAHPDSRTFIGSGKAEEVAQYCENNDIDLIIFDDDLSGKQTNILEEIIKRKIVDRSSLILDIFANNAQTAQAKAQVELAQMQYMLPRLRGLWTHTWSDSVVVSVCVVLVKKRLRPTAVLYATALPY